MCQRSACKFVHQMYFTDVLTRATVLKSLSLLRRIWVMEYLQRQVVVDVPRNVLKKCFLVRSNKGSSTRGGKM